MLDTYCNASTFVTSTEFNDTVWYGGDTANTGQRTRLRKKCEISIAMSLYLLPLHSPTTQSGVVLIL